LDSTVLLPILTMFGAAVSVLFAAYSGLLMRRLRSLEKDLDAAREENKDLERENKTLTAMIVLAGEDAQDIQELRKQLARMLRGDP
jgi:hypothetical protein